MKAIFFVTAIFMAPPALGLEADLECEVTHVSGEIPNAGIPTHAPVAVGDTAHFSTVEDSIYLHPGYRKILFVNDAGEEHQIYSCTEIRKALDSEDVVLYKNIRNEHFRLSVIRDEVQGYEFAAYIETRWNLRDIGRVFMNCNSR